MNTPASPSLLEDALRGYLSRRCKRAYAHDVRNGLQGLQAGLDALARAARPNRPSTVPLEQLTQFVQQAITNHERGLERVVDGFAPEESGRIAVGVREFLGELSRFLASDAARHRVRIRIDLGDDVIAEVSPTKLRLILLAVLTDAIDTLSGGGDLVITGQAAMTGQAAVTGQSGGNNVCIDFVDGRTSDPADTFVVQAIAEIAAQAAGRIDRKRIDSGYRVRLELPAWGGNSAG